jgi:hypothetical protein
MIWTPPRGSRPPGFRPPGRRPPAARSDLVFLSESHILHLATPTRPSAAPPGCPPPPRPAADRSAGVHVASVRPGDSRGLMMTIFDTTSTTCTHPAAPNTFDSNRLVACAPGCVHVMFVSAKAAIIRSREPPRDDKTGILPGTHRYSCPIALVESGRDDHTQRQ